jgi:hypothetical protein
LERAFGLFCCVCYVVLPIGLATLFKVLDITSTGLQEKQPFRCEQTGHDWIQRTLYQLIVDVPTKHLNLLKLNLLWDLISLSLVVKGILVA